MAAEILLIDDDKPFLKIVSKILEEQGYATVCASSGRAGLRQALERQPSLVVLDMVMPGLGGLEVCQELKQRTETAGVPILIVTGNDKDGQDAACLDMGADDYVTKPIGARSLLARCRALLRRSGQASASDVALGELRLDYARKTVWLGGRAFEHLTPKEFELLHFLASRSPQPFDRVALYQKVWSAEPPSEGSLKTVEVHVRRVRLKLGLRSDQWLVTIAGRGYAVVEPNRKASAKA